jgi:ferredoxin
MPDVVLHYSSTSPERMIFREELKQLATEQDSFVLRERHTDTEGLLDLADLDREVPDWRDREVWACGPGPMLDAAEEFWEQAGLRDRLHVERFTLELGGEGGEGGTITFQNTGKSIEVDGATTVLEAGEQAGVGMPYGCRMGVCHTCTVTLLSGRLRDLRNGEEYADINAPVQTCITAAVGDCTLDI